MEHQTPGDESAADSLMKRESGELGDAGNPPAACKRHAAAESSVMLDAAIRAVTHASS